VLPVSDRPDPLLPSRTRWPILGGRMNMPNRLDDDPPPFFRTWSRLYAAVLIVLFVAMVLLYWLTEFYIEVHP